MSTTITYKGSTLTTLSNETKKLNTAGTWLEDDITIQDQSGGGTAIITDTTDAAGGTIRSIVATDEVYLQSNKTVTPTNSAQIITPDAGYDGLAQVTVEASVGREDLTGPKDVDFIDYDGRLLYSYTAQEFLALDELPANPINPGLIAQGWNWTLSNAQEYVEECGGLCIGQMYIPTDGKTHILINIPKASRKQFQLYFGQTVSNGVVVGWGDGTTETISGTALAIHRHEYESHGKYDITIGVTDGSLVWNNNNTSSCIVGPDNTAQEMFYSCRVYVESIFFGSGFTSLGSRRNVIGLQRLRNIIIPHGVTSIPEYGLASNPTVSALVFPDTIVSTGAYAVQQNYSLKKISLPKSLTSIGAQLFRQCYSLTDVFIPRVSSFSAQTFYRGNALQYFTIPKTVTSIGAEAFYQCYSLKELHLLPITPPSLANTNAFTSIPSDCIFYVPYSDDHSILNAYKTATNWSTFASKMQEEPQS